MILKIYPVFFLKKIYFWKNYCIFVSVILEKYILILNLIYLFILFLKYLRMKRMYLFCETWVIKKYDLYIIIYILNLKYYL